MKILAIVDDKHTCECCGKTPIKRAAAVEIEGEIFYYGMICATKKHFQKKESELKSIIAANKAAEIIRVSEILANSKEVLDLKAAFCEARELYRFGPKFSKHISPFKSSVDALTEKALGKNLYKIRQSEVV